MLKTHSLLCQSSQALSSTFRNCYVCNCDIHENAEAAPPNFFKLNSQCMLFVLWESRHNESVCTQSVYSLDLLRSINCHLVRKGKDLGTELKEANSWYQVCNLFWLVTRNRSSTGHFMMDFFPTSQQRYRWYLKNSIFVQLIICVSELPGPFWNIDSYLYIHFQISAPKIFSKGLLWQYSILISKVKTS